MTDTSPADLRRNRVLAAAMAVAERDGYPSLTREAVAAHAGVSVGTVSNAYGSMTELRDAVMDEAVRAAIPAIVAQGLAQGHPAAKAAPLELRQAALGALV